jgi:LmbE family N-acetylglucosaminyl deacetylase
MQIGTGRPMKVLAISPHTDDAELGCGGTLARFISEGNEVRWVAFSAAEDSLPEEMPKDTLRREFQDVLKAYGLDPEQGEVLNFKVRNLNLHRQEILERLIQIRKDFSPDVVLGPSLKDFHQDHEVVAREMIRAFKTSAGIACYELPWNHVGFDTQMFVRLRQEHLETKWKALTCYKSQIARGRSYLEREFIFGLARTRGIQCDSRYAEAFEVVRWMI